VRRFKLQWDSSCSRIGVANSTYLRKEESHE
jgi:hypothetical protein